VLSQGGDEPANHSVAGVAERRSAHDNRHVRGRSPLEGAAGHVQGNLLRRSLLPASSLASWGMIGSSILMCLRIFGIDSSPILTIGSVSGFVLGFASQNLLLNLITGISIFLTRPFVVGDMVCMRSMGRTVAEGTISHISPLRISFVDLDDHTVTLPNKMLWDMVITTYPRQGSGVVCIAGPGVRASSSACQGHPALALLVLWFKNSNLAASHAGRMTALLVTPVLADVATAASAPASD
jgi:Mechanosensitive ion channel